MKLAVTYENGQIFQHFGRTAQFKLYDIEDGKIVRSEVVDTNGSGHGALAGFLMSKSDKWWLHMLAMVAGEVVLYLIGTVWFCVQAGKTASAALAICVYPFIPLDIVKMVIVVLIGPMISSRLKKAHLNV